MWSSLRASLFFNAFGLFLDWSWSMMDYNLHACMELSYYLEGTLSWIRDAVRRNNNCDQMKNNCILLQKIIELNNREELK